MGGRMNLAIALFELLLSAVMVTVQGQKGYRGGKVHIANEMNIQADEAAAEPEEADEAIMQADNATKNIQADETAAKVEAEDEDEAEEKKAKKAKKDKSEKTCCETYPDVACVNEVAYGCTPSKSPWSKKAYCWSSCATMLDSVGWRWLKDPKFKNKSINMVYLECDQDKPDDDLQCAQEDAQGGVCYPGVFGEEE